MNHEFVTGTRVHGYVGQLAETGHKFGTHTLTQTCKCSPTVMVSTAGLVTVHHQLFVPKPVVPGTY
jgi:hypothetical protein